MRLTSAPVKRLGAAAIAAFCAAWPAAAQMRIVSERHAGVASLVLETTKSVTRVKTKASVEAGGTTFLAAITLVNEGTCTANGPGAWVVKKAPLHGTVSTGTETGPLADGKCPGMTFTFATISYTSTAAAATHDRMIADWSQAYQGVDYITIDTFLVRTTN